MQRSAIRALAAALLGLLPGPVLLGPGASLAAASHAETGPCIYDHAMLRSAPGTCRPRARAYPPGVTGRVRHAVYDSALTFGVPYPTLLNIARCESNLNPRASHAGHYGLFQFLPATFREGARGMRGATGITAHSYWNPRDASYVAGYLFAIGLSPRWTCVDTGPTFGPP